MAMAERNATVSRNKLVRRALEAGVAAVWLVGSAGALQAQSAGGAIEGTVRSLADRMPEVAVWLSPNGLPTATTLSPTRAVALLPSRARFQASAGWNPRTALCSLRGRPVAD